MTRRPRTRRLSSFRDLVTLRFRHSWTSWRQRVQSRRLAREQRRLTLLEQLLLEQQILVERLQYPLLEMRLPSEPPPQELLQQFQPEQRQPTVWLVPPEPEEMPSAEEQLSLQLGPPPRPHLPPSSES